MSVRGDGDTDHISAQEALIELADPQPPGAGYVPRHGGPRRRKGSMTTSLTLHEQERELLERLAIANGITLAEVWRRGLRAYARESDLDTNAGGTPT